jgi:N-methylhydantoinase A
MRRNRVGCPPRLELDLFRFPGQNSVADIIDCPQAYCESLDQPAIPIPGSSQRARLAARLQSRIGAAFPGSRAERGLRAMSGTWRVGCDIGGTFTDFVLSDSDSGRIVTAKRLTTPADPSVAMLAGLAALDVMAPGYTASTTRLAHATTLIANAVIERKGAKVALLTTRGFRDVVELRRYVRVTTYEMYADPPAPLVPRHLRFPVHERTRADGSLRRAVDSDEIAAIAGRLAGEGVTSVAVVFLHSFANPANERAVGELLARLLPGVAVSLSSDVLPRIKEYERTSTTLVNAYVKPLTAAYLGRLETGVRAAAFAAPLQIMLSNGGIGSARTAAEYPVRLIESGPVAGAVMAQQLARLMRLSEVIAYDMGGTTAKACLIRNAALPLTDELEVARSRRFTKSSGFPVATPAVNMIEVGAGGGSIARVNALDIVEVGPESAAAAPGPACYGLGGGEPTVTDADLVLGYLDTERFAGGSMRLDRTAAERAIVARIGAATGATLVSAAWTIHDVVNESMAAAIRMHVSERGGDPSRPVLVAFGGAGPVHVANLAGKLGIRRVVVPARAGVLSALGLVLAPAAFDIARTRKVPVDALDFLTLADDVAVLSSAIRERLAEVGTAPPHFEVTLGLGYIGQSYHVSVPVAAGRIAALTRGELLQSFAAVYREKYGYFYDDVAIELVSVHVTGIAGNEVAALPETSPRGSDVEAAIVGERRAWSARQRAFLPFAVYRREHLAPGVRIAGPCLVEEDTATTVIDIGGSASVDRLGSLDIAFASQE